MKQDILQIANTLRKLHKRFLDNLRYEIENNFGRTISPYEFLSLLTQNIEFAWLKPFSALVAEIDAISDEPRDFTDADIEEIGQKIQNLILDPAIAKKYLIYSTSDTEFAGLHIQLNKFFTLKITLGQKENP